MSGRTCMEFPKGSCMRNFKKGRSVLLPKRLVGAAIERDNGTGAKDSSREDGQVPTRH